MPRHRRAEKEKRAAFRKFVHFQKRVSHSQRFRHAQISTWRLVAPFSFSFFGYLCAPSSCSCRLPICSAHCRAVVEQSVQLYSVRGSPLGTQIVVCCATFPKVASGDTHPSSPSGLIAGNEFEDVGTISWRGSTVDKERIESMAMT